MEIQALEFERPIVELEQKISELKALEDGNVELKAEIKLLERKAEALRKQTFSQLTAWQVVQLSRHPARPYTADHIAAITDDFVELHGDRQYADDAAIIGGLAHFRGNAMVIIGHQKGRGTKENVKRNFGMPKPEGYRKAKRLMELAGRFGLPLVTFIDTPGAYPGIDAEERGQAEAIASNLELMARLPVPIISIVIGEGGSGGALAIGVADRLLMLQYSTYSVISPEGCASILWKDSAKAEEAARVLHLRAEDIHDLGVADEVIEEPLGGAQRDPERTSANVAAALRRHLTELRELSADELLEIRYAKYRRLGAFAER